jgi:hypothetical protein
MNLHNELPERDKNESVKSTELTERLLLSALDELTSGEEVIPSSSSDLSGEPNYPVVNLDKLTWSDLSQIEDGLKNEKVTGANHARANHENTKVQFTDMDLPPPGLKSWDWWLEKVGVPLICALIAASAVLIGNLYN